MTLMMMMVTMMPPDSDVQFSLAVVESDSYRESKSRHSEGMNDSCLQAPILIFSSRLRASSPAAIGGTDAETCRLSMMKV